MSESENIRTYEHPFVTVDIIVLTILKDKLHIILIKRGVEPYKDQWALPGGFVRVDESIDHAAKRELAEEVGVETAYLEQLYTFGEVNRDPRSRVITVAYYGLINGESVNLAASTDASDAQWFPIDEIPKLAFDHDKIVSYALERVKAKIGYSTIAYGLLPEKFRLSELQKVYEIILGVPIDKRNFRKKMLSLGLLESTKEKEREGAHRPAELYRFKENIVKIFD